LWAVRINTKDVMRLIFVTHFIPANMTLSLHEADCRCTKKGKWIEKFAWNSQSKHCPTLHQTTDSIEMSQYCS